MPRLAKDFPPCQRCGCGFEQHFFNVDGIVEPRCQNCHTCTAYVYGNHDKSFSVTSYQPPREPAIKGPALRAAFKKLADHFNMALNGMARLSQETTATGQAMRQLGEAANATSKAMSDAVKFLGVDENGTKFEAINRVIIRGAGRPDAEIVLTNGSEVDSGSGKKIVGIIVGSGCEIFVETGQYRTFEANGQSVCLKIYSYDMTLGGPYGSFQGLKGIYEEKDLWVHAPAAPLPYATGPGQLYTDLFGPNPTITFREPDPDDLPNQTAVGIMLQTEQGEQLARSKARHDTWLKKNKKVKAVKKRGERKLALDKDI